MDKPNSITPHLTQTQQINVSDLLDQARKLVNDDLVLAEYNINLALLSSSDDYSLKIQSYAIKSYINFKKFSYQIVLGIANKFLRESKKKNKEIDLEVSNCFVRSFYRAGDLMSKSKTDPFLSAYFWYKAKLYSESNENLCNNQEVKNLIENGFISILEQISLILNAEKEKAQKSRSGFLILDELKQYFINNEINISDNENTVYLISSLWLKNMFNFINKKDIYIDKIFDRKSVCQLYFSDGSIKEEHKRYLGNFPGPINNIHLVQFKDYWHDPDEEEAYTNIYLNPNSKENLDFNYLPSAIFKKIKDYFKCNKFFEIERKIHILDDNNKNFEIHLKRIKVLVLSNLISDKFQNFIKPRFIQISKKKTIYDLKQKIVRSLFHITNNYTEDLIITCKIYMPDIPPQNTKSELFRIIYSYNNKFNSYKIKGEEMLDDSLQINDLKFAVKDVLIIEVSTNHDIRKTPFINLLSNIDVESFKCSLCEVKSPINSKLHCEQCEQNIYCSDTCRKNDEVHIAFHKNMSKLYKKKFELTDLITCNISELLTKSSRGGLTGLKNLGNTCFMNSALQCLSNCEELTKYFLMKKFVEEVNRKNKYGSGGQIAKAYYELIKELWNGMSPYLSPWDFRQIFVGFVKQFAGFSQHDSHEMLAFMLDALHEDLNRVKDKPYSELKEKMPNESEEQASNRWWMSHLSRENSIIVDLFHGQYKSVITCPDCDRISITYDPFMYMGLPIPSGQSKIKFKFFPNNYEYEAILYELTVNDHTTVKSIKDQIRNLYYAGGTSNNSSNGFSKTSNNLSRGSNINGIEAIVTTNKVFKKIISDEGLILYPYENNYEVIFYENEIPLGSDDPNIFYITFHILPIEFVEEKTFFGSKSKVPQPIFYSKPFTLASNQKVVDLFVQIFKFYRKVIPDIKDENGVVLTYKNFLLNINDSEYVKNESLIYLKKQILPFNLFIINNIPDSSRLFCEFCNKTSCNEYCPFNFNIFLTLDKITERQKLQRPILIMCEITNLNKENKFKLYKNIDIKESSKNGISQKENISIYDCLEAFRSVEKLEKENAWYCTVCKQHQQANKKLEIYTMPNVLIVQFKRFKIKTNNVMIGTMANKKNDSLITFPIDDLDLRKFCVSESEKSEAIYELFAISQHFGSLSSGHYTALCRNKGKWYHYDDERVSQSSEDNVVTPAAYLLFYRKKNLNSNNFAVK